MHDELHGNYPKYSLSEMLSTKEPGIIAEFKRRSPSKGVINDKANVIEVVRGYADQGAVAVSILTDRFFDGSLDDFIKVTPGASVPLLRKDFIIDEYQVHQSFGYGASIILLIAAILSPEEVRKFSQVAHELGMEVLLELHDEHELGHICDEVDIVGVNNRNLKTFEVNIDRSLKMAEKIPGNKIKIAESGIDSVDDIVIFRENGFKGFLIGELFMKEKDPAIALAEFVNALQLIPPHAEGF